MEYLQDALTTKEWKEILDSLLETRECIEVRLELNNEIPTDFLAQVTERLRVKQKLVSEIASYLVDRKEFQPGDHDEEVDK